MRKSPNKFLTKGSLVRRRWLRARWYGVLQAHDDGITRITLRIDYQPKTFMEEAGDKLGIPSTRVEGDLRRFKNFIEARGVETGAWRGKI
jgi:hypothetical protein